MGISHLFTSAKSDGADDTVVQPGDWNDDHVMAIPNFGLGSLIAGMWNNSNITAYAIDPFIHSASKSTGGLALTSETTTVLPFSLPANVKVSKVHFEVTTGYGAVNMRIVIYDHNAANGRPDSLLDDSGDISVDNAGVKTWDVSPDLALSAGELYWMGIHKPNTDVTGEVRSISGASRLMAISDGFSSGTQDISLQAAGQSASAPADPYPATHSLSTQGIYMMMEIVAP